jgi:hypothetical protein
MRHDRLELIGIEQAQRFSRNQKDRAGVQTDGGPSADRDQPKLHVVVAFMEREDRPDDCQLRHFLSGRGQFSLPGVAPSAGCVNRNTSAVSRRGGPAHKEVFWCPDRSGLPIDGNEQ